MPDTSETVEYSPEYSEAGFVRLMLALAFLDTNPSQEELDEFIDSLA